MKSVPKVADYMSGEIRSIHLEATIKEAGQLLQKYKVGSLLVDDGKRYVGIITDTDMSRKVVAQGVDPITTPVKRCMSKPIISVEDDQPLSDAVKLMKNKGIRHLAVTQDNTIIGILSVSDLLRYYSGIE
jgi:CBS domain-containing protein